MPARRRYIVLVVAASLGSLAACSDPPLGGDLRAQTARVTHESPSGAHEEIVELDACERDQEIVVVVSASEDERLQLVADLDEGGEVRSGVTFDVGATSVAAFGADAAPTLGADLPAEDVGRISRIESRGDRLLLEADVVALDDGAPTTRDEGTLTVVARCPDETDA
jgi:hypothetical protein